MASSANLFIDPDGVRAAGASVSGASSAAAAPAPAVTPCAADSTSVKIAYALSASISELVNATMAVNHKTAQAGSRMNNNATTYEEQEQANAASLTGGSRGRATSVPIGNAPSIAGPPLVAAPIPTPGVQPASGKEIAALMHGGPGPEALETAGQALNAHAAQLDSAAQSVRSARWTSEQNWDSAAAAQASTHLATLESTYTRHADQSRALSRDATVQANNFRQARANIPTPQYFTELEQRLRAASTANANSGGRYTAAVTKLQTDLAAAHQQAVSSYTTYTAGGQLQAEPLEPGVATATTPAGVPGQGQPGSTPGTEDGSLPGDASDAADGTVPTGNVLGDPTGGGAEMMQTLLPTVLGVVAGAAGGLLGALSGAADKVQQAGSQLVGGLAQGGASALQGLAGGQPGGSDPSLGEGGGPGDLGLGGGGGSEPGDTEPASAGDGSLAAAPTSAAAAPAVAPAPTVGTGAPTANSTSGGGMGMGAPMGGMMPPMMGMPGRGGGGSEEDKRLYEEKRLRLTTPPNAEPVKGRVEARESRSERRDSQT